jgi:hypothetical protein
MGMRESKSKDTPGLTLLNPRRKQVFGELKRDATIMNDRADNVIGKGSSSLQYTHTKLKTFNCACPHMGMLLMLYCQVLVDCT